MKSINEMFDEKLLEDITEKLKASHLVKMGDVDYRDACANLNIDDLYLYSDSIELAVANKRNCMKCEDLMTCTNHVYGNRMEVELVDHHIVENYYECDFLKAKKSKDRVYYLGSTNDLREASISAIYTDDVSRIGLLKSFKEVLDNPNGKGIYLHGGFGCGKSYCMAALVNKLSEQGYKCGHISMSLLLGELKKSYSDNDDYLSKIKKMDILVLDDIGGEYATAWSRDEVLGSILQYRMENKLLTMFTSNHSIDDLEKMYGFDKNVVNARRICDRIRFLSNECVINNKTYR